jgi:hypothetical protein
MWSYDSVPWTRPGRVKFLHVPMHVQKLDSVGNLPAPWPETGGTEPCRYSPALPGALLATPQDPAHPPGGVLRSGSRGVIMRLYSADAGRRTDGTAGQGPARSRVPRQSHASRHPRPSEPGSRQRPPGTASMLHRCRSSSHDAPSMSFHPPVPPSGREAPVAGGGQWESSDAWCAQPALIPRTPPSSGAWQGDPDPGEARNQGHTRVFPDARPGPRRHA